MRDAAPQPRLGSIDGWRAVAVLGVFWWHAWIHTGNPAAVVPAGGASLNLQRLLVLLGNGVDFFFVLSGFCIYLSLGRGLTVLTASSYVRFVFNRWRRLSPAFYAVCLATAGALVMAGRDVSVNNLVAHAFWLYGVWPGAEQLAPPFWSLQVEWEFYLCAPLLLLIARPRIRWVLLGILMLASLTLSYAMHNTADGVIPQSETDHLPLHLPGFVFGMILAEGWRGQARWLARLSGPIPLLLGLALAYLGRGLVSTEAFVWLGSWGVLAKTLASPVMTLGFALMAASTLGEVRWISPILLSAPMQTVGRLSYGLYLWHWWPCLWIGHALRARLGDTVAAHYLTFAGTVAVCLPLAWLTYVTCERAYFRHAKRGNE